MRADALLSRLEGRIDPAAIWRGDVAAYRNDGTKAQGGHPALVLRPANTAEVSQILAAAHELHQPLVVQGGRTGLAGGARVAHGDIVLSTERMRQCEKADPQSAAILCDAGVAMQTVQDTAAQAGLMLGVDIGARGSATIGGNIATNAGGIRVLRYGMFRAQVRGLEAVLADGTIISSLNGLPKDNAGYDLKQLFIGSEGTLGVVTRARLALWPLPRNEQAAFCALPSLAAAHSLLRHLRMRLGGSLSAFEAIWGNLHDRMRSMFGGSPIATGASLYVLIETQDARDDDGAMLVEALAQAQTDGLVQDAVLAKSQDEVQRLWRVRENCSAFIYTLPSSVGHDVSLADAALAGFLEDAAVRVRMIDPQAGIYVFGHLGDGNVHYIVETQRKSDVSDAVYHAVAAHGGSISAEHGIGLDKRAWLHLVRAPAEIALMRTLKQALDPRGILNPGRILGP